jgi:hypothetical protein
VDTIEQHSCGQIKITGYNGMFFKSFDNFVLQGKCFRWNSGTALEAEQVPPEEPESVSGYTTTVDRAPNAEPWDGHEGSNSSPSSALGQTVGTPLSIPENGSISDLLPPASSDTETAVPSTSAAGLSPEQIELRRRAAEGRTVNYQGPNGSTNTIVNRGIPVERPRVERPRLLTQEDSNRLSQEFSQEDIDRYLAQPGVPQSAIDRWNRNEREQTTVPATSRTPVEDRPTSVFNPRPASLPSSTAPVGPLIDSTSPVEPSLNEYLSQRTTSGPRTAGGLAVQGLPDPTETTANAEEATAAFDRIAGQEAMSSIPALPGGGNTGYFATGDNCARPIGSSVGGSAIGPGGGGGAFPSGGSNIVPPAELVNDLEWQAALAEVREEFPQLEEAELYRIIQGESGFDTRIVNRDSGATGLFQFIPSTAAGLGTSTGAIQEMTAAQQLRVYQQYLRQSDYRGGPLGMIQAAPSTYRRLIREYGSWDAVPRNIEVYPVGSAAWQQNPVWRDSTGRVTIGGIEAYYADR